MATIFDAPGYLEAKTQALNNNPDIEQTYTVEETAQALEAAGFTPLEHYQAYGEQELADAGISFDPFVPFNVDAYIAAKTQALNNNPDIEQTYTTEETLQAIQDAGFTPLEHYKMYGQEELAEAGITFPNVDQDGGQGNGDDGAADAGTVVELGDPSAPTSVADLVDEGVDNIKLNAQSTDDDAVVSAEDVQGLESITSYYSTSDLTVLEVQAGDDSMAPGDVTVGMNHTTGDDSLFDAANMTVKFDQDDLSQTQEQGGYYLEFLNRHIDEQGIPDTSQADKQPVEDLQIEQLQIKVGGQMYDLAPAPDEISDVKTVQDLVDVLNQEANETPGVPASVKFEVGPAWTDVFTGVETSRVVITNAGKGIEAGTIDVGLADLNGDLVFNQGDRENITVPVAVDVALTKVGQSTDGGGLIIGSAQASDNSLGNVNTVNDTVPGVQTFNVTVNGGAAKSSSLSYLQSTENALQTVDIDSDNGGAESYADLYIGNSNTLNDQNAPAGLPDSFGQWQTNAQALKDVATLNASDFDGDLTVYAGLTDEFVEKYGVNDPAEDGQNVVYTGGSGNDAIHIAIAGDVAAASQEGGDNLNLSVIGGKGDDLIDIDGSGTGGKDNDGAWTLAGGKGNDTFHLSGSSDTSSLGNSTIVLDQGLSAETIIGFSHAADSTSVAEVQELDLAGYALNSGESVTLNIAGQSVTYTYDKADNGSDNEVSGSELAAALDSAIDNGNNNNLPFNAGSSGSTLQITANNNVNIGPITAEIGDQVVAFETTTQGATDEQVDGNDVLDFSSYDLDALVVAGEGAWKKADTDLSGSGSIFNGPNGDRASTDAFIALINEESTGNATDTYNVVLYQDQDTSTANQQTLGTLSFANEDGSAAVDELDNATAANFIINEADAGLVA